jgi:hypothetical protein
MIMKLLFSSLVLLCFATAVSAQTIAKQDAEKIVKTYFSGYENKDWNTTAGQLADGFTFSSPAGDDHIPIAVYKERCFPNCKFFQKFNFLKIMVDGNTALIIYEITTTNNKIIRNVEYWAFSDGKVKSIECFFGGTGAGYPANAQNK